MICPALRERPLSTHPGPGVTLPQHMPTWWGGRTAGPLLQLRVRTEDGLRVDGLRVLYQLDLAPAEGALGCSVVVPTLDGPVQLRVPPGSSSGRLLRLRGRGLQHGQQRGDQLVEIRLVVPSALTEAEEALYARLQQLAAEFDGERA